PVGAAGGGLRRGNAKRTSLQQHTPRRLATSSVRQKICFERAATFSLPLLLTKGGEGWGEEALFIKFPSLRLSPRSFLAGRERQNAASVLRAEHIWLATCETAG